MKEGDEAARCLFIGCAGGNETIILKSVPLEYKGVIKVPNAHIGMNTTPRERRRLFKIFKLPTLQIMYMPFAFTLGVGVEEFNP